MGFKSKHHIENLVLDSPLYPHHIPTDRMYVCSCDVYVLSMGPRIVKEQA